MRFPARPDHRSVMVVVSLTHWLHEVVDRTLTRGRAYARDGRVDVVCRAEDAVVAVVAAPRRTT